jgi:hypothetical protein
MLVVIVGVEVGVGARVIKVVKVGVEVKNGL